MYTMLGTKLFICHDRVQLILFKPFVIDGVYAQQHPARVQSHFASLPHRKVAKGPAYRLSAPSASYKA